MTNERSRKMAAILQEVEAELRTDPQPGAPLQGPTDFAPPEVRTISPDPLAPKVAEFVRGAIVNSAKVLVKEAMEAVGSYVADAHALEARVQQFAEDIVNTATQMATDIAAHHARLREASERLNAIIAEVREKPPDQKGDEPPADRSAE
jgi:hypothetical protein